MTKVMNVLMAGTGEYTTGFKNNANVSDKGLGVIGLCLFDLRRRGKVGKLSMCGTTGKKHAAIRKHLENNIEKVYKMSTECTYYPDDKVERDTKAYIAAIDDMSKGDAVMIFTPDDTHYDIAAYAVAKGLHVFLAKPPVKTVAEHKDLITQAENAKTLAVIDYHKRWDPIYADARMRIRGISNECGFFNGYMSQPKFQLETFRAWAGKGSDISYYLNSHHIDFHCWSMQGMGEPIRVTACAATGIATGPPYDCAPGTEDTITLLTQWKNKKTGNLGTAVYTSSWVAPNKAEAHTQQRFQYLGKTGEIRVDQTHRGYDFTTDDDALKNPNPLYMKYTPDEDGLFAGQNCYGYKSIECFIDACLSIEEGRKTAADYLNVLPTLASTVHATAILEAGRKSLDNNCKPVEVEF